MVLFSFENLMQKTAASQGNEGGVPARLCAGVEKGENQIAWGRLDSDKVGQI